MIVLYPFKCGGAWPWVAHENNRFEVGFHSYKFLSRRSLIWCSTACIMWGLTHSRLRSGKDYEKTSGKAKRQRAFWTVSQNLMTLRWNLARQRRRTRAEYGIKPKKEKKPPFFSFSVLFFSFLFYAIYSIYFFFFFFLIISFKFFFFFFFFFLSTTYKDNL